MVIFKRVRFRQFASKGGWRETYGSVTPCSPVNKGQESILIDFPELPEEDTNSPTGRAHDERVEGLEGGEGDVHVFAPSEWMFFVGR